MKRLRVVVLVTVLAGLLAACGSDPTPTPIPTPTPVPPTPTPIPPTDTPVAAVNTPVPGGGFTLTPPAGSPASAADLATINDAITKTATVDSYHFAATASVPGMLDNAQITGDYKSPNTVHTTIAGAGQTQELINIGNTGYVKNADGSWTSHDLTAVAGNAGGAAAGLGGLGAMAGGLDLTRATNLFGTLARYVGNVNSATVVGPETVNGQGTTHYSVPIFLGNLMGTGGSTTPGETPLGYAQVWVDPSTHLVQRLTANVDLTDLINAFAAFAPTVAPDAPTATPFPPVRIQVNMDLTNFGQIPDITPPANVTPGAGLTPAP